MVEVLETEILYQRETDERVSPLQSTPIGYFDDGTKDKGDFSNHSEDIDNQFSTKMYTVDSSCSPEEESISIETDSRSNEDESVILSPTSSTKIKPNYHRHPKPPFSYIALIAMAIKDSPTGKLTLAEINEYLMKQFPFFRGSYTGWRNSVRHNLSLNECFIKILRDPSRPWGKDNYWTINESSDYTFADGVFRRRRKRITRIATNDSSKSRLHGLNQQQQSKGKFTGPFSIDSILGTNKTKDDDAYKRDISERVDSNPSSPTDIYPLDQRMYHVKSQQQHSIKSPTRSELHEDLNTFPCYIPPSTSSSIGHFQRYHGLTGRYVELERLQYSSRVKPEASSAFVPLSSRPFFSGEYRVQLPWTRSMMPLSLAPPAKQISPLPRFLVENLIS